MTDSARLAPAPHAITWHGFALTLIVAGCYLQLSDWQYALMLSLNQATQALPDAFWAILSVTGLGWAVLILVSALCRQDVGARVVVSGFVFGSILTHSLKPWLSLPRPGVIITADQLHFIGHPVINQLSMPSGHSLAAFCMGALWVCLIRTHNHPRWLEVLAWLIASLIGMSRIAVGAHWPADVLVGAGLGLIAGWWAWRLPLTWPRVNQRNAIALPVLVECMGAVAAFTFDEGMPQGLWWQWALGGMALVSIAWRLRDAQTVKLPAKKFWMSLLVTLAAVAVMAWMLRAVNWDVAVHACMQVPAHVWFLSAVGLAASHVLRAGRVRHEWKTTLRMGWQEAWALMVRHSSWVVLVPMRGGEAIYVWALHRQGGISLRQAGISLLRLRLQDMAVLGGLAVALFAPFSASISLLLAAGLMALAFWVLPLAWTWLMYRMSKKEGDAPFQAPPPAWESWIYAISNWLLKTCAIAWPMWIMLPVDFRSALHGSVGGELAATLPVQPPAGFGPYEAGVIFGVQWSASVPWPDIAAAALAVHLLALAVTVGSATIARLLGWSRRPLRRLDGESATFSS